MADEAQAPKPDEKKEKSRKKINRLTAAELGKKIDDITGANQTKSVYYSHLLARKSELETK
jgi:hypothetical protein